MPSGVVRQKQEVLTTGGFGGNGGNGGNGGTGRGPQGEVLLGGPGGPGLATPLSSYSVYPVPSIMFASAVL